ncbi:NADH-quinone oxidoreductase subunit K [Geodia barretti]|uniref:NADH-ubiquinone oxidoreductase chain 4L n=1 Tax=Geodia barretti TaxID=519541 RepID=A0AA35WZF9_GEOBA|nr:NADH-quinone oxidoreductase subunit K [Geodia barretti]
MSIELMLNAVNINLIAAASHLDGTGKWANFDGQIIAIFVITVAAAEVGLAMAIILRMYRNRSTVNVDEINLMKCALYMARAMFVVFYGRFAEQHEHVHDAPPTMSITMGLLAVFALVFGLVALNWPGSFDGIGKFIFYHEGHGFEFVVWLGALSTVLAVVAFIFGFLVYARRSVSVEGTRQRFAGLLRVFENKYYVDEMYQWGIDRVVLSLSRFVAWLDRALVNDVGINGPADITRTLGNKLRYHVTGYVYSYALAMALGLVGLAIFWWIVST